MSAKSCFFIGHRDSSEELYPRLEAAIEELILNCNVAEFIVGNYGNFDRMVHRALTRLKVKYPFIGIYLLLPYYPAPKQQELLKDFDGSIYPEGMENSFKRFNIVKANRYALERADYLIAHARFSGSNSQKMVEYAHRLEKKGKIKVLLI